MNTEITHEYVLEHIQGILNEMKKTFPEKESRNWIAALKKPDVMTNVTYMGYIKLYHQNHTDVIKRKRYIDRIDAYDEKEYHLENRVKNQAEKEEKIKEKEDQWRNITQHMRWDMMNQMGKSEYERWVSQTLGNIPSYYGV
tara:strand:- start:2008 stop:2430 length:423 start_codon:yes stop_codon:yes gene_type:complete